MFLTTQLREADWFLLGRKALSSLTKDTSRDSITELQFCKNFSDIRIKLMFHFSLCFSVANKFLKMANVLKAKKTCCVAFL